MENMDAFNKFLQIVDLDSQRVKKNIISNHNSFSKIKENLKINFFLLLYLISVRYVLALSQNTPPFDQLIFTLDGWQKIIK
jgi:hypothetical protein